MNRPRPVATSVMRAVRSMARFPYDRRMIRERSRALRALVGSIVLAIGACACAQGFAVATWNMNWLMDTASHARWTAACERTGWAAGEAPAGLPFCDVHNSRCGFRPMRAVAAAAAWPRAARYPAEHPCRCDAADLARLPLRAEARRLARDMSARLDATGIGLVALQEVFDGQAPCAPSCRPTGRWRRPAKCRARRSIAQHVGYRVAGRGCAVLTLVA